ncbi:13247_t:CDS:2, partial [Gigaspora rosea]
MDLIIGRRSTQNQLSDDENFEEDYEEIEERYKFLSSSAIINLAYFGALDLLGEDVEARNLFSDCEWEEMVFDFEDNIKLEDLQKSEQRPL